MRRFRRLEPQLVNYEMEHTPNLDPSAPLGHIFSQATNSSASRAA
jgi:hypothetical protein